MYSHSSKLQLQYTALTEEMKVTESRNKIINENSIDPCTSIAGIAIDGWRKPNTRAEIENIRSKLRIRAIVGETKRGREGLGLNNAEFKLRENTEENGNNNDKRSWGRKNNIKYCAVRQARSKHSIDGKFLS